MQVLRKKYFGISCTSLKWVMVANSCAYHQTNTHVLESIYILFFNYLTLRN